MDNQTPVIRLHAFGSPAEAHETFKTAKQSAILILTLTVAYAALVTWLDYPDFSGGQSVRYFLDVLAGRLLFVSVPSV